MVKSDRARIRPGPRPVSQKNPTIEELTDHLRIDEHTLESDCVYQPELFYQVGKQLADKEAERDATKQRLSEKMAEIELLIREEAENSDSRVTVNEVSARVTQDSGVRSLSSALLDMNRRIGQLKTLKESYMQRKDMLRELVALYINNYYSDPARGAESRFKDAATEQLRRARRERGLTDRR